MGIYAWHKLNFLPPLQQKKEAKQKAATTFLLKLPFNHLVIASTPPSLAPQIVSTRFAYLIQLISQVHLLCRLISTIYFNKPPNSIWLTNWLFHLLVLLLLSPLCSPL